MMSIAILYYSIFKLIFAFMKKLLLGLGLGIVLLGGVSATTYNNTDKETYDSNACRYGQCYATAKSTGNRCKHCVSEKGDYYCWQHR